MAFTLDDLDFALDHAPFVGRFSEVRVADDGDVLELDVQFHSGWATGSPGAKLAGSVGFRFGGVRTWSLDSAAITRAGVNANHPALIAFEASTSRLSYRGRPADADGALAALHLAHARTVGDAIPIDLRPGSAFPPGWSTGTIAEGSTSLMQVYAEVLREHGVEPILAETKPFQREPPVDGLSVFEIGNSYVVAATVETSGDIPLNDYV